MKKIKETIVGKLNLSDDELIKKIQEKLKIPISSFKKSEPFDLELFYKSHSLGKITIPSSTDLNENINTERLNWKPIYDSNKNEINSLLQNNYSDIKAIICRKELGELHLYFQQPLDLQPLTVTVNYLKGKFELKK